jgi:hypothetical protein
VTLLNGGNTPLGFYDITVTGTSGGKSSTMTRRMAAIENSWQKHVRVTYLNLLEPPPSLVRSPIFAPTATGDEILYVEAPNATGVNLRRITAFTSLGAGQAQAPRNVFRPPGTINGNQSLTAEDKLPDLSPLALGQDQLLFSSQMDPDFGPRCPNPNNCTKKIPLRIWTVRRPSGLNDFEARVMTRDSTFFFAGNDQFYAFDFLQPRWDPTATGYPARIAYISDMVLGGQATSAKDVWLADLVDTDGDNRPDDLINHEQLTTFGNVVDFDWHPNGQSLYVSGTPKSIRVVSVASGTVEREIAFALQDSLMQGPRSISVFQRPGEHTLIAFQGTSENLTHLYVYDEEDDMLTRVTPFPFPLTATLFPSWHPSKKWLTYACDYSVLAWSTDTPPFGNPDFEYQPRTAFPSAWVMKFED